MYLNTLLFERFTVQQHVAIKHHISNSDNPFTVATKSENGNSREDMVIDKSTIIAVNTGVTKYKKLAKHKTHKSIKTSFLSIPFFLPLLLLYLENRMLDAVPLFQNPLTPKTTSPVKTTSTACQILTLPDNTYQTPARTNQTRYKNPFTTPKTIILPSNILQNAIDNRAGGRKRFAARDALSHSSVPRTQTVFASEKTPRRGILISPLFPQYPDGTRGARVSGA